jgi:response regulator NasT
MENALIVSSTDKGTVYFTELLNAASVKQIAALESAGEARRLLLTRDFDLVIINAPLRDESGEGLARHIASKGTSQVILVVEIAYFDAVSSICEGEGILTVSKPVNRTIFWAALKLAGAVQSRFKRVQAENVKLKQKIEDIRIIDRAKCLLISYHNMSESKAHRYIEKQAMDMRSTKRQVAEEILKVYDNYQETE